MVDTSLKNLHLFIKVKDVIAYYCFHCYVSLELACYCVQSRLGFNASEIILQTAFDGDKSKLVFKEKYVILTGQSSFFVGMCGDSMATRSNTCCAPGPAAVCKAASLHSQQHPHCPHSPSTCSTWQLQGMAAAPRVLSGWQESPSDTLYLLVFILTAAT